jgi:hypothetical protein
MAKLTEKEAMEIGMRVAEDHMRNVMDLVNHFGSGPRSALNGCLVSLAATIMAELQKAQLDIQ